LSLLAEKTYFEV
jgi:hypothetical protein